MATLFQQHPPKSATLPLSFGIEQALLDRLREQEAINEASLVEAILAAYLLVYPDALIKQHMQQLIDQVLARLEALQKDDKPSAPLKQYGKTIGTNYSDWLSQLDSTGICLYLADYDIVKACDTYWRTDLRLVKEAVKLKGQQDSHKVLAHMEACMYGFGGRYSEDDGNAKNFDLNSSEGLDALRSVGF
jgi:hypothetical protein